MRTQWNESNIRWLTLIIICFMTFAYNYCYSCPIPVQDQLTATYGLSSIQYNLLFSILSWPNIILCFMGGIISDKIGVRSMTLYTWIISLIGHFLFIVACIPSISSFPLMIIGRCIFGTSGSIWTVVRKTFLYEFFNQKQIAFAMALNLASSAAANIALFNLIYQIYETFGIVISFASGLFLQTIFLLAISLLLLYIKCVDLNYIQTKDNALKKISVSMDSDINSYLTKETPNNYETTSIEKQDENMKSFCNNIYLDIKEWDIRFWLITFIMVLSYGIVNSWMNIASSFMHHTYSYEYTKGNSLITIIFVTMIIMTTIMGYVVDRYGKRCYLLILSSVLLICAHCVLVFIDKIDIVSDNDNLMLSGVIFSLLCVGISYGIFPVVSWPAIILVVNKNSLSTAYGMMTSFVNLVLAIFPLIIALLTRSDNYGSDKYTYVEYFIIFISVVTTIASCILCRID
eukprot:487125_1